jgi:hypothetical protein
MAAVLKLFALGRDPRHAFVQLSPSGCGRDDKRRAVAQIQFAAAGIRQNASLLRQRGAPAGQRRYRQ